MISLTTSILFTTLFAVRTYAQATKPNVLLVLLDDLGFTDTSYYADEDGTNAEFSHTSPFLDALSVAGVKFDYHYSESTCSPSRAALLSGRYSFRNGIDQALIPNTNKQLNPNYPIIPEVLHQNGYNTFMAGKWHLGSNNQGTLPPGRGFDESVFYVNGNIEPFTRMFGIGFGFTYASTFTAVLMNPATPNSTKDQIQQLMDPNGYRSMLFNDFWKNEDYKYKMADLPQYMDDTFFYESLAYIQNYNDPEPWFMYVPFQSPHSPIVDPCQSPMPGILPAKCDSTLRFPECEKVTSDGRKNLCRMIADSAEKVDSIIQELKATDQYDNTVIIILSDNGAQNNFLGNFGNNALAYGQNLPFRGAKVSAFEGGIRTPSILTGGYIDINYPDLVNCAYSDLIYIADWYDIILSGFAGVDTSALSIDAINLLPHIQQQCEEYNSASYSHSHGSKGSKGSTGSKSASAEEPVVKRDEIISFRYCDETLYPARGGIQAGWVRSGRYKLVINGSYAADCGAPDTSPFALIMVRQGLYLKWDGSGSPVPDEETYLNSQMYNVNKKFFKSKCYDRYLRHPEEYPYFLNETTIQKEFMLFDIKEDKIEACDIADDHPDIVNELYQKMLDEVADGEFIGTQLTDPTAVPLGQLYAMFEDYQCPRAQSRAWEEVYAAAGSPDAVTIINDVFTKISTCPYHPFQPQP